MGRVKRLSIQCENPMCKELITPIKRVGNKGGQGRYHSRDCYYFWTPGISEVYKKFRAKLGRPELSAWDFMAFLLKTVTDKYGTWTIRAQVLGVARHTLRRWLRHFKLEVQDDGTGE